MEKKSLESMVSKSAYEEIVSKTREKFGNETFGYIFPAIKKALEEGSAKCREEILIDWLEVETMRVCTHCGAIMQEGWYLDWQGYACSDECCCAILNVSKEDYEKYSIFRPEIEAYLEEEGEGRKIEDLSKDEVNKIIDQIMEGLDGYYYTEWY